MREIVNTFKLFFKVGKILGFYPFKFTHDCQFELTIFGAIYSTFMLIYWFIAFVMFSNGVDNATLDGSEMSRVSYNLMSFILTAISAFIILVNLLHHEYFEKLIKLIWNFDFKVSFKLCWFLPCFSGLHPANFKNRSKILTKINF